MLSLAQLSPSLLMGFDAVQINIFQLAYFLLCKILVLSHFFNLVSEKILDVISACNPNVEGA